MGGKKRDKGTDEEGEAGSRYGKTGRAEATRAFEFGANRGDRKGLGEAVNFLSK
jgi:hypothetical protein